MGSQTKTLLENDWAYIAGFFDGDGSLMVQLKNRRDTPTGWRVMFTICFYQHQLHQEPLHWMQKMFGIGYLQNRNDNMAELRINGYGQVMRILEKIEPYIKFKRDQVNYALAILKAIDGEKFTSLPRRTRAQVAEYMIKIRVANYKTRPYKYSSDQIRNLLTF